LEFIRVGALEYSSCFLFFFFFNNNNMEVEDLVRWRTQESAPKADARSFSHMRDQMEEENEQEGADCAMCSLPTEILAHIFATLSSIGEQHVLLVCEWGCLSWRNLLRGTIAKPLKTDLCAKAAARGYLGTIRWARERGCPWNVYVCAYLFDFRMMYFPTRP
jgi:hypothetical protein